MNNKTMEEEIKKLQKHMGGLVRTIIDLKSKVEALENKAENNQHNELANIMEKQEIVDKAIAANSEAIIRIDQEILSFSKVVQKDTLEKKNVDEVGGVYNKEEEHDEAESKRRVGRYTRRKCRYFNRGYCKFTSKCRYYHPESICQNYLKGESCNQSECPSRHPKGCKWVSEKRGCLRPSCVYLHSEKYIAAVRKSFKCEGCKAVWEDEKLVVGHIIQNTQTFFCLNCEDWIKNKENVLSEGWTMFDDSGNLRDDV